MVQAARAGQVPDLYVASQKTLMALKEKNLLEPHVSDRTDTVLNACKDGEGYWTGIWLNPAVFAVNVEFASAHPAFFYTWDEVLSRQSVRLVMTDFIASEYSEESLMALVEHFGEEGTFQRLRDASAHIVQYGNICPHRHRWRPWINVISEFPAWTRQRKCSRKVFRSVLFIRRTGHFLSVWGGAGTGWFSGRACC